ncbi:ALQxL family class IV lanthipeptide [Kitasatospora azatica]|nr:ALQxL family class IV lanthipeptide [Kitasatospora azatica]
MNLELDLDALQQLPTTEAQATGGGDRTPDCGYTCANSCTITGPATL